MARWYLTSDSRIGNKLNKVCTSAGLNTSGSNFGPNYYIESFQKRAISNTNFIEFENENWICSAGTIISDGKVGREPLRRMYETYLSEGINEARSDVMGHYAVAIKNDDSIVIFTDPQGAFRLYYDCKLNTPIIISNSLQLVAEGIEAPSVDLMRVLDFGIQLGETGEKSFYNQVKRLFGSQKIKIDVQAMDMSVEDIKGNNLGEIKGHGNISKVVDYFSEELNEVFNEMEGIDSIGIHATGGLDSRTVLAGCLNQDIRPLLIHGVGNSELTNTKIEDYKITRDLSDVLGLGFYQMDWSDNHPHDYETLRNLFKKYGFMFRVYGGVRSGINELNGGITPYPKLQLSGYGPVFSNSKPWELPEKSYSFEELLDIMVHDYFKSDGFECTHEFKEYMMSAIQEALNNSAVDYPANTATLENLVQSQTFLRLREADTFLNFANEFSYHFSPFMTKRLHDPLVSIPMEYRKNNQFQLRLLDTLHPDVLNTDIISGWKKVRPDFEKWEVRPTPSLEYKLRIHNSVKKLLPESIKPHVIRFYNNLAKGSEEKDNMNATIRRKNMKYIEESSLVSDCISDAMAIDDLRRLVLLQRTLFGIEEVGYERQTSGANYRQ